MKKPFFRVTLLLILFSFTLQLFSCAPAREAPSVETVREPRDLRLLVLGRDRAAGLADTVMIVSLRESDGDVRILQIPRDTYAEYTDRDYKKLNGALPALGLSGMKRFLSEAMGISIAYAVCLDLEAVEALVDTVGGVSVEIPMEMHYSDPAQNLEIHFPQGPRRLDGREAVLFLRYRSGYADADLGRMNAQRQFLQSLLEACQQVDGGVLTRAVWKLLPYVQTDLPIQEILRLCGGDRGGEQVSLSAVTAPGAAVQGVSGAWYYSLNRAGVLRELKALMFSGEVLEESSFDPKHLFDREENPDFHNVYIAPPMG